MDNVGLKRGYLEIMDYRDDYAQIYEEEKDQRLDEKDCSSLLLSWLFSSGRRISEFGQRK